MAATNATEAQIFAMKTSNPFAAPVEPRTLRPNIVRGTHAETDVHGILGARGIGTITLKPEPGSPSWTTQGFPHTPGLLWLSLV